MISEKRNTLIILGAGKTRNGLLPIGLQNNIFFLPNIEIHMQIAQFLDAELHYVAGFEIEKLRKIYPNINFIYNKNWSSEFNLSSLNLAFSKIPRLQMREFIFVLYGDVIHTFETFSGMLLDSNFDLIYTVGSKNFTQRTLDRPIEKILINSELHEFTGLILLKGSIIDKITMPINEVLDKNKQSSVATFINEYIVEDTSINSKNFIVSDWVHLEHSKSISNYLFKSKAENLKQLENNLNYAKILPLIIVSKSLWNESKEEVLRNIQKLFENCKLIIRSSAKDEDSLTRSNAGRFLSLPNVPNNNLEVTDAINKVFSSYNSKDVDDLVFVQEFIESLSFVGVAFTRTSENGAPYRQIEISNSNNSSLITGGLSGKREIWKIYRQASHYDLIKLPEHLKQINKMLIEIELLFGYHSIDVEFGIDMNGDLIVFQVRPLVISDDSLDSSFDNEINNRVRKIQKVVKFENKSDEQLPCETVYSNMADWNPAEIIGRNPAKLALDLYNYCITDQTWAIQRRNNGYKKIRNPKLLKVFGGKVYVDVGKSIKSFIPSVTTSVDTNIFINGAINKLKATPAYHDKIEFQIVPTCMDFSVKNWEEKYEYLQELKKENLINYKKSLAVITNKSIKYFNKKEIDLESFYHNSNEVDRKKSHYISNSFDGFLKLILSTTKNETALEFAHDARLGFISISLLRTAVENEILSQNRVSDFLNTVPSVSSRMLDDAFAVKIGKLSYSKFRSIYGHLRPGTYDISVNNYFQDSDFYLKPFIENATEREIHFFELSRYEKLILDEKLSAIGLDLNSLDFINFAKKAIAAREWSKFKYSRSISIILECIKEWGSFNNLTINDLRHVNLNSLLNDNFSDPNNVTRIKEEIQENALDYKINLKIELPDFITSETNLFVTKLPENNPSFPTMLNARGPILILNSSVDIKVENLNGVIVAMESADPGYDFILGNSISGIITAYGGPNSHMAIRCSEIGIPAVIGIGVDRFRQLQNTHKIEIDSINKVWRIIN